MRPRKTKPGIPEALYSYKGNCCRHCGTSIIEAIEEYGSFHRLFEFHHVDDSNKADNYKSLIRRKLNAEQLDEVDKCVLLCVKCHKILHEQDHQATAIMTAKVGHKTAKQTTKGQVIINYKTRTARFLSNDPFLLIPYIVKLSDTAPFVAFGTELNTSLLIDYYKNISSYRSVVIKSYKSRKVLFALRDIGNGEFEVTQNISFPITIGEFNRDDTKGAFIWLRHGVALTSEGKVIYDGTMNYTAHIKTPSNP